MPDDPAPEEDQGAQDGIEELNLTDEDEERFGGAEGLQVKRLEEERPAREVRTVDEEREQTRGQLARGLLLIFALTLASIVVLVGFRVNTEPLTQTIFPSVATLVGSALGFYFGAEFRGGLSLGGSRGTTRAKPGVGREGD